MQYYNLRIITSSLLAHGFRIGDRGAEEAVPFQTPVETGPVIVPIRRVGQAPRNQGVGLSVRGIATCSAGGTAADALGHLRPGLLLRPERVAQLVRVRAILQTHHHVRQVSPVGARSEGNVRHSGLHQCRHLLADVVADYVRLASHAHYALEMGLRLGPVPYLAVGGPVLDLGQVGHRVPHGDGAQRGGIHPAGA